MKKYYQAVPVSADYICRPNEIMGSNADGIICLRPVTIAPVISDEEIERMYPMPPFEPSHNYSKQVAAKQIRDRLSIVVAAQQKEIEELKRMLNMNYGGGFTEEDITINSLRRKTDKQEKEIELLREALDILIINDPDIAEMPAVKTALKGGSDENV